MFFFVCVCVFFVVVVVFMCSCACRRRALEKLAEKRAKALQASSAEGRLGGGGGSWQA